ncbi:11753_t:CDS:1 [Acaulospora colombiana]|uniref:11753_t:CDS:1 n=1 Tax=Acaulospora colombiana TaxID=27376 RepID=A0ACA9P495_9GLOM|nr:11753_t:CDS:1 [Acaulospora colombiana]
MGPNTVVDNFSDLGSRDIYWNHDWAVDARYHSNIEDVINFAQRVPTAEQGIGNLIDEIVDDQTLNKGTGKSYLIKKIRAQPYITWQKTMISLTFLLVLAPTWVAAFNIHSTTIYSELSISTSNMGLDIDGERLKQL